MIHLSSALSDDKFIERRIECAKSETIVDLFVMGNKKLKRLIEDKRFDEIFKFKRDDVVEVICPIYISLYDRIKEGEIVTISNRIIDRNNRRLYSIKLTDGRITTYNKEYCFAFPLKIQEISTDEITNVLEG